MTGSTICVGHLPVVVGAVLCGAALKQTGGAVHVMAWLMQWTDARAGSTMVRLSSFEPPFF